MRSIPDPGFPGDDGSVSEVVREALAHYARDPTRHAATLSVLQHARLLVPVVAVLGDVEHDEEGNVHDKSSDMATVLMAGRDGRSALLAFTGGETMARWDAECRPVPVTAPRAAEAALQDGASTLLVDVAGPVMFVVEHDDLRELARGSVLIEVGAGHGWVTPAHRPSHPLLVEKPASPR